jgi:hypothetical protein
VMGQLRKSKFRRAVIICEGLTITRPLHGIQANKTRQTNENAFFLAASEVYKIRAENF